MISKTNNFPGLTVYDTFVQSNPNSFGATIVAEIDPVQYWRDRPLFLGYKKPIFSDAINWNKEPINYIDNPELLGYLDAYDDVISGIGSFKDLVSSLEKQLKDYSTITENDPDNVDYPNMSSDNQDINIKDADGNIIRTITTDMNQRSKKITPDGLKSITILDDIPESYTDDLNPVVDEATIVSLSESFIKDKLWIAHKYIPDIAKDINNTSDLFTTPITDFTDLVSYDDMVDVNPIIERLSKDLEIWYGIPLINLSPRETPTRESIILHLDTKNDFTLNVTNVIGTGLEGTEIKIDKTIPPGKRFTASIYININKLTIYLNIEGDNTTYENSILLFEPPVFNLTSFGTDNDGLKSLCGYIWDVRHLTVPPTYIINPTTPTPYLPGDGVNYNMGTDTIDNSRIYPIGIGRKPASNGGDWLDLDTQWRAVYNGYLDRFFCRTNLKNTSFSISWYQYQLGYPQGIKTLVSDNIHNNYIKYDYDNFKLIIDFNSTHKEIITTLPEFMWFQVSIRFDYDNNILVISFRDFFWKRIEEFSIDVGEGLEFELMSLWGRFSSTEGRYMEIQEGAFTLLNIHDKYQTDIELDKMFQNHLLFLNKYDLKDIPYTELP